MPQAVTESTTATVPAAVITGKATRIASESKTAATRHTASATSQTVTAEYHTTLRTGRSYLSSSPRAAANAAFQVPRNDPESTPSKPETTPKRGIPRYYRNLRKRLFAAPFAFRGSWERNHNPRVGDSAPGDSRRALAPTLGARRSGNTTSPRNWTPFGPRSSHRAKPPS